MMMTAPEIPVLHGNGECNDWPAFEALKAGDKVFNALSGEVTQTKDGFRRLPPAKYWIGGPHPTKENVAIIEDGDAILGPAHVLDRRFAAYGHYTFQDDEDPQLLLAIPLDRYK